MIKLGGSLMSLPDMPDRVRDYLARQSQPQPRVLLVGGGQAADAVRFFDRHRGLEETTAHWLAIRGMNFHAHLLAAVMPESRLAGSPAACRAAWEARRLPLIEPLPWLERDEECGRGVPHRWAFTSDSIAAHLANQLGAGRLTLLKSTLPAQTTLQGAAEQGVVDACLPTAAGELPVELVNLRNPDSPAQPWHASAREAP
jgi:aspartokinase-like uncharacterized kinase